jgi:hypothetical protein
MSLSKKLYLNFGFVLAMVIVLFLVIVVAVQREHSAKAAAAQALQVTEGTDKVRSQVSAEKRGCLGVGIRRANAPETEAS